jgi:DNA repair protein RadD
VKICDACGTYNHTKVRFCTNCGTEFQFQIKIVGKAGSSEIIKTDAPVIERFNVDRVIYNRREGKEGKPPYIRVTYYCGMLAFNENVFPEHKGYPRQLFKSWWQQRHPSDPPVTVNEAMQVHVQLRTPKRIRVWCNRKFPEILSAEY